MKKIFSLWLLAGLPAMMIAQTKEKSPEWIGKVNRIANPGAEANSEGKPLAWQTDFATAGESNWVSPYGVTSHEWTHGEKKLGLPPNPGNNYFRLSVNRNQEMRILNIYQKIPLSDLQPVLAKDTVIATFRVDVASNYNTPKNCSFALIRVLFYDQAGSVIDSFQVKRILSEFRDLDAGTPDAVDRGFNVMHEFKPFTASGMLSPKVVYARVEARCEFPCSKHVKEDEEETEGELANTFFFDNFSLGFYRK
jgi:hypothetical protein